MNRISVLLVSFMKRLRGEMGRALVRTFIARAIAMLGLLALTLVVGRLYGTSGMGVYALAQGVLLGAGILAKRGMDSALMRYVGQDYQSPNVLLFLRWAVTRSLVASLFALVVIFLGRSVFESVFGAEGVSRVLVGIALAVPAYVLGFLFSGFFKGVRMPATACLLENGSIALIAGVIIITLWAVDKAHSLDTIGYAYALAAWGVAIQGGWQLFRWCKFQPWWGRLSPIENDVTVSMFKDTASAFFVTQLASFMQSVLGVMIAGLMLTSSELGLFKSSQQMAILIGFVLIVINTVFPPRFASLYHQGKMQSLGRLARQGALLGSVIATPLLLMCLAFPAWVLDWFGEGFSEGSSLLRIIAIAQLVNVATGSVGFLLNMTGHERLMRNIALVCNALGLLMFFVFISLWEALGAALALAFVLIVQNLTALLFVWRKLGIWILPVPNILLWIGIKSERH